LLRHYIQKRTLSTEKRPALESWGRPGSVAAIRGEHEDDKIVRFPMAGLIIGIRPLGHPKVETRGLELPGCSVWLVFDRASVLGGKIRILRANSRPYSSRVLQFVHTKGAPDRGAHVHRAACFAIGLGLGR